MNASLQSGALWLVRHGESEANAGAVTTDYAAIGLTSRGRIQAAAIATLVAERPAWVGLSPYLRARQTAEPLLSKYPELAVETLDVHEFTYLAAASCMGMNTAGRQPLVDAYWSRMDPDYIDGDGAESFAGLCRRATSFLETAASRPGLGIVFSHEQLIRAVLMRVLYPNPGQPQETMRRFFAMRKASPILNGAILPLRQDAGHWWMGGLICSHLQKR